MTADPRIEPDAKVLKYVDYDEVFQMAEKGAKVIHPRAVELAKNADIILQIKNTYNPNYEGTKIGPANVLKDVYEDSSKVKFMSAVAHKDKIAQVKVIATEDIFSRILNEMEEKYINLDMINYTPDFQQIKGTVSSVRLDSLLPLAFSSSRSKLSGLIEGAKVFVNGKLITSNGYQVREGDLISVRGLGKFRFEEAGKITKKNRISVTIQKYV